MSRVAKNPIIIPKDVQITRIGSQVTVRGPKGELSYNVPSCVQTFLSEAAINISVNDSSKNLRALSGTARANLANLVKGVTLGYERKLLLVGVGYRAQVKESALILSLGFSHTIEFTAPKGVIIETPSQTEVLVKGCDKQAVGQAAANIRSFRPPEPYKGKGIRYSDEIIIKKEAKKK